MGQGPIGLLFTRILSLKKIKVIACDLLPERINMARKWGASATFNPQIQSPSIIESLAGKTKFDAMILAVPSNEALKENWSHVRGGGKILLFAHTVKNREFAIDLGSVCVDEIDLIGSYSSDFHLQTVAAHLIFSRKLDVRPLLTDTHPLEEIEKAIWKAKNPGSDSLKTVIEVGGDL
jgi:L-iditol 2-dehydrogenase